MATMLRDEIESNFSAFENQWPTDLNAALVALRPANSYFADSFVRISSIQAWRTSIILGTTSEDSEAFFFEAQNDFLTSHCLARCGSFRQALKALRSAIENIYFSLFYKDHPIELKKWEVGKHKLGYTEAHSYFESHPSVAGQCLVLESLETIKAEYSTLSKAVHGSAKSFRMTQNLTEIRLWSDDLPSVSKWACREKAVIINLNILLIYLFRERLVGASNRNLRETMALIMTKKQRNHIKDVLKINLTST